jgi:eukaryotic-like serine/threonine-protein kinase
MASQRELAEQLFEAALDLKPEDRAAFLDRECNRNAKLRQEVEARLAAVAEMGSFLEHPTEGLFEKPATTVVGPYHLLELIGEGGMGQVWLAEQKQPVRRRVAIKLIKAGMDTREVVARFESERQALALMDHPVIAKVFDAGSTSDGRPYFVMEYVAGVPITTYCDRHKLTVRQRMELLIQVCEGVQHAHQKAIIHRDLKPSNILVSEVDGKPMPHIIDFGVAKATSQKLTAQTVYTRVGTLIGTLGYMSPEQADPIREDIDTRTDVYSLGAVLYELLTGALPLDFKKLAYDQVLRRLRNQDVLRPSTKITTLGEESTVAAKNRGSDPPTLVRQLRGDPDAIALKALEKDRNRRYATPSELAADIGRYLRNEPVTAHSPSTAYRARKYLRRHRLGLAVAAIAVLAIALLVTWWRTPPSIPVVESVVQLTDDGEPKDRLVSDGSRIYFQESRNLKTAHVSVTGGAATPVEMRFARSYLTGITHNGSALLVAVPAEAGLVPTLLPLWLIPLPGGEPRRLGSLKAGNADIFADGRIVFIGAAQGPDGKGNGSRVDWFLAEKDGSNPRKLVSLPGHVGNVGVSPDGQRIVLTQEQAGDRRLFEISADGSGPHDIRRLSEGEQNFRWSSDGRYLIYESGTGVESDIWLLPMQTWFLRRPRKPIRLTNGPIPYSVPYPSPDGKQIFVLGTKQRGQLVRYDMQSHQFEPFLSGISATDPTFSRDGKWVAYASYPDRTLWCSRGDGTERKQLTFPPMSVFFPSISPDGTKISFHTDKSDVFVISRDGGTLRKIADNAFYANWSPDGNYLLDGTASLPYQPQITDVRTGKNSALPSGSSQESGFWLTQDILVLRNDKHTKFMTFNLKTQEFSELSPNPPGDIENWILSPDSRYVYFTTGGTDPKAMRLRIANHQIETITSLKDLHRAMGNGDTQINVAPDGSPIFTRDAGYQEIYALNIRWP